MSFDDDETIESHELRITRCRACRAQIVFLRTAAGRQMPVDADTVDPEDQDFDGERHTSHFASCPKAGQFRRPKA